MQDILGVNAEEYEVHIESARKEERIHKLR